MSLYFDAAVIYLAIYLPEVWSTHRILSVDIDLEEIDVGNELGDLSVVQCKVRANRYWKMGKWKKFWVDEQ